MGSPEGGEGVDAVEPPVNSSSQHPLMAPTPWYIDERSPLESPRVEVGAAGSWPRPNPATTIRWPTPGGPPARPAETGQPVAQATRRVQAYLAPPTGAPVVSEPPSGIGEPAVGARWPAPTGPPVVGEGHLAYAYLPPPSGAPIDVDVTAPNGVPLMTEAAPFAHLPPPTGSPVIDERRPAPRVSPPPTLLQAVARVALVVVAALALGLAAQLTVVSGFEHRAAQQGAFNRLRLELAKGTAPLGQTNKSGHPLALGTPMAVLEIPTIGVHQVVLEGTTSAVLMSGPGLSRSSQMPGDAGVTMIFGRQAAYGAPFGRIHDLRAGDKITIVTGEGISTYLVLHVRRAGNPVPAPPAAGKGQLTLVTANGTPFLPSGVLRVDAKLISPTLGGSPSLIPASALAASATSHSEQVMAGDPSTLWTLMLWLEALVLVALAATWSWYRWGHRQAWIVFIPPVLLISIFLANQFAKLLPNLL